jgi:diadenosine tetraphosphate (Ap4A) HIT family hydrolase
MNKRPYVFIENVRDEKMQKIWQQILDDGIDPFAREHLSKYHTAPILMESDHWIVTDNDHPYKGSKRHLLFITKTFYEQELVAPPPEVLCDLYLLAAKITKELDIKGGTLWTRFGDPSISFSTVLHFHAQLIEPERGFPFTAWYGRKNQ